MSVSPGEWRHAGEEPVLSRTRRFAAAHDRELTLGDVHGRYAPLGTGPAVLWLTGGLRHAAPGFTFPERLAAGHTVVAPDYPPVTSFADIDAGLSLILRAEGGKRCDLVGQSYGGPLAQAFLAVHPERVRRLVLSSSGPGDYGRVWLPVLVLTTAAARVLPRRMLTPSFCGASVGCCRRRPCRRAVGHGAAAHRRARPHPR